MPSKLIIAPVPPVQHDQVGDHHIRWRGALLLNPFLAVSSQNDRSRPIGVSLNITLTGISSSITRIRGICIEGGMGAQSTPPAQKATPSPRKTGDKDLELSF
jgi:hypothetical protein